MDGDNGPIGSRSILGDLTNLPEKRGVQSISGDLGLRTGSGYGKNSALEGKDMKFAKKVCLGLENLVNEKCRATSGLDGNVEDQKSSGSSPTRDGADRLLGAFVPADAMECEEVKDKSESEDAPVVSAKDDSAVRGSAGIEDLSGDGCLSSVVLESGENDSGGKLKESSEALLSGGNAVRESMTRLYSEDATSLGRLAASECGSTEWSMLPKPQSSYRLFGLDRCAMLAANVDVDKNTAHEQIKTCSCLFCLKASYIWSDLHYQDLKGRLSVLKKSRKEASNLVQKSSRGKQIAGYGQVAFSKTSKLEYDLMAHWNSLFLNMEDILAHENNQLQASFATFKALKETCRTAPESKSGPSTDKNLFR